MLLSRLPCGTIPDPAPSIPASIWAFPLVGALVGALMWAGFAAATALGLPPFAAALIALAIQALATGGLHEDGLADTADGFGGGAVKARKLEIMKDSRIGSYGVLALIFTLGLSATAIAEAGGFWAFLAIGAASRTAMLWPMTRLPAARDDGLGHSARAPLAPRHWVALGLTLVLGLTALPALPIIALTTLSLTALFKRQIGGQTGDTLGATQKLTECAGWLTLAALTI